MKKLMIFIGLMLTFNLTALFAQVAVNNDGTPPSASAMLEVKSNSKGILIPRVNTSQRTTGIASPAESLLVYDIDTRSFWYFKTGIGWLEISTTSAALLLPYTATANSASPSLMLSNSGTGAAIAGDNTAAIGETIGVTGSSASTSNGSGAVGGATGVLGTVTNSSPGGYSAGVRGVNNGTGGTGIGVVGYQAGSGWGVYGETPNGFGVFGLATDFSSANEGVRGETYSTNGVGMAAIYSGSGAGSALEVNNGAIKVTGTNRFAFVHTATVANKLSANGTDINNPLCNNDPNCILIVTQKLNPAGIVYNNSPIGVYYNTTRNRWEIFNEANTPIPVNALFDVLIIKQ